MAQKPLTELDLEALYKQKSMFTGLLIMMGIAWLLSLGLGVYNTLTQKTGFSLIAIAMSFIPIGIPLWVQFHKIKTEIKSRNSNL